MGRRSTLEEFITKSRHIHGRSSFGYDKTKYINNKTKVELYCFSCKKYFKTRPCDHTSKKTGCPRCCLSKSEKVARKIIEKLLNEEVGPATPTMVPWLLGLYLDGYSQEKKFAFEYQGYQHSIFPNRFHKTKEQFEKLVENDKLKAERCKENGVNIIHIPYKYTYKNKKLMKKFIIQELKKINFL